MRRIAVVRALLGLVGLGLGVLGAAQCSFSPNLSAGDGALKCAVGPNACPEGTSCMNNGYCCKPGDDVCALKVMPTSDGGVVTPDMGGGGADMEVVPPPPDGGGVSPLSKRRIVGTANTHLIGFDEACTRGIPASTLDRWCAFTRGTELWVINVTKAATTPPPCNGTDPSCRLLTSKVFLPADTSVKNKHTKPQFFGDLLIYYTDPTQDVASDAEFRGAVMSWHPLYPEPRRMTSNTGFKCLANPRGFAPVAWCADYNAMGNLEARAGTVAANQPLPLVWTLGANDSFLFEVNRAGDRLLFMQTAAPATTRSLYIVPTADTVDPAKRVLLAPAIKNFEQNIEGDTVYVLREDGNKGVFMAEMATGKITELLPAIEGISALDDGAGTDLGLVAFDNYAGETANARLLPDKKNPAAVVALGRVGGVGVSSNKAYSLISTMVVTPPRLTDAKVFDNATLTSCTLQAATRSSRILPFFSASSKLVYWMEPSVEPDWDNVWVATAAGCKGVRMLTGQMLSFNGLPNDAVIYKQRNPDTKLSTIVYQRLNPETGATVAGPWVVHEGVGLMAVVEPNRKLAVYSATGTGLEGIWLVDLP
jgi:hypothetical protein